MSMFVQPTEVFVQLTGIPLRKRIRQRAPSAQPGRQSRTAAASSVPVSSAASSAVRRQSTLLQ
ncbi:hypothetical protein [Micromonospora sp. LOL_015]|uniref:hypothetical protein n=1 Tax=Micromonospora sp. LOL_015 TaxID=3345416 RepID=UPI003A881F5D